MRMLKATWSMSERFSVSALSTAMTEAKGTEPVAAWSRTQNRRGKENRLAFRGVSSLPITNGVPAYKFVHFIPATMFLVECLHSNAVGWIRFHVVLVLRDHGLNARFVLRLVPQHGFL